MLIPKFEPVLPKHYRHMVVGVRNTGRAYVVFYDVWSEKTPYREQRAACLDGNGSIVWDHVIWADGTHYKEMRQQKVDRVRLKAKKRRHW